MIKPIYCSIRKLAEDIGKDVCTLDVQDKKILAIDGAKYLRHIQTNLKLKKDILSDLSDTEKRVLLAYIVFLRQNITTSSGDNPNEEDSAYVLHGKLYDESKEDKKELDAVLKKQLSKIGIS